MAMRSHTYGRRLAASRRAFAQRANAAQRRRARTCMSRKYNKQLKLQCIFRSDPCRYRIAITPKCRALPYCTHHANDMLLASDMAAMAPKVCTTEKCPCITSSIYSFLSPCSLSSFIFLAHLGFSFGSVPRNLKHSTTYMHDDVAN
jgi:hypothetical protein